MIEKHPQTRSRAQAALNAATSGPSTRHMIEGLVSIDRPCSAYSGKTTRSSVGMPFFAFVTMATIFCTCARRSTGVATTGSCSCTSPMTTPRGDLFNPPSPLMASLRCWYAERYAGAGFGAVSLAYAPSARARAGWGRRRLLVTEGEEQPRYERVFRHAEPVDRPPRRREREASEDPHVPVSDEPPVVPDD